MMFLAGILGWFVRSHSRFVIENRSFFWMLVLLALVYAGRSASIDHIFLRDHIEGIDGFFHYAEIVLLALMAAILRFKLRYGDVGELTEGL